MYLGVSSNNASSKDLGPYPAGATLSLVNFANFNQDCIDVALTLYMQYLPFVLLIQAVSIIFIEKLLMKFPRVSGKIERFYGTIVEESLFGKDPDVAEDVQDTKCNVEVIARRRRRNEVCMSLKRSKIIHNTYIMKNIVEILVLSAYIPLNLYFTWNSLDNLEPSKCVYPIFYTSLINHNKCLAIHVWEIMEPLLTGLTLASVKGSFSILGGQPASVVTSRGVVDPSPCPI